MRDPWHAARRRHPQRPPPPSPAPTRDHKTAGRWHDFSASDAAAGAAAARCQAVVSDASRGPHAGPTLGIYPINQGGGLDFVSNREYGRLRWLKYPAETREIDLDRLIRYGGIVA